MTSSRNAQARREAAADARRKAAASARRRRVIVISAVVVVVLVALTALVIGVRQAQDGPEATVGATPANVQDDAIVAGDGPVTVTLYEDLQCPACQQFEAAVGPVLDELVESGDITLERRLLAFLDRASSDRYSSRAANAVACVVDTAPEATAPYVSALFERQPSEGGAGLDDAELTRLAEDSGAADVGECIAEERFGSWVRGITDSGLSTVSGTPTLLVDGEQLDELSPDAVRAAVEAARS